MCYCVILFNYIEFYLKTKKRIALHLLFEIDIYVSFSFEFTLTYAN